MFRPEKKMKTDDETAFNRSSRRGGANTSTRHTGGEHWCGRTACASYNHPLAPALHEHTIRGKATAAHAAVVVLRVS